MQFAHREMLRPAMWALAGSVVVYLVVQHTMTGALGTSETMAWGQRLIYWSAVALLQAPISYASCVLTLYIMRQRRPAEIALGLVAMALILSAPCTAIVLTIHGLLSPQPPTELSLLETYGTCAFSMFWSMALLFHVLWIRLNPARAAADEAAAVPDAALPAAAAPLSPPAGGAVPVMQAAPPAGDRHAGAVAATAVPAAAGVGMAAGGAPAAPAAGAGARFFDRLPDDLGRDIIYVAASAHYVDVVTAEGSAAILLRFSDAVAELGDLGVRVHRSYWVAYPHVKRAFRRDGRTLLLLTDDHEVRVGRNYLPEVRAALPKAWIRARRRTTRGPSAGAARGDAGTSSP